MIKNKTLRFLLPKVLLLIIGLAIASFIALSQIKSEEAGNHTSIVASNFGGPLELTDHTGAPFTDADFKTKYKDQYRLIYFGFTYCPAICPTELQRMASVIKDLGSKGDQITPFFITVDPERDTVDTMKNYVELFHPRLIGLTGTPEQTEQAKKSYKIYAAKVKDETMTEYTMDHSSFIYFIDANNNLLRVFKADDSTEHMKNVIEQYLG